MKDRNDKNRSDTKNPENNVRLWVNGARARLDKRGAQPGPRCETIQAWDRVRHLF